MVSFCQSKGREKKARKQEKRLIWNIVETAQSTIADVITWTMSWPTIPLPTPEILTCSCLLRSRWRFRTGKGLETRLSRNFSSTRGRTGTSSLALIYDLFTTSPASRSICTGEVIATAQYGLRRCQCKILLFFIYLSSDIFLQTNWRYLDS